MPDCFSCAAESVATAQAVAIAVAMLASRSDFAIPPVRIAASPCHSANPAGFPETWQNATANGASQVLRTDSEERHFGHATIQGARVTHRKLVLTVALLAGLPPVAVAAAAEMNVPLANDVVPAPAGLEPVTMKYVAAKPTDLYISVFTWAGKVKGEHLNAGEPVDVLARPIGYDW